MYKRQVHAERVSAYQQAHQQAEGQLREAFQALSADALKTNNEAFLSLAETRMREVRTEAASDIDARKKAIEDLLAPMAKTLEQVDREIKDSERRRVESGAQLMQKIASLDTAGQGLRDETRRLTDALKRPGVRGRWGELQLKRVVELAGMVEHCDFVQQETSSTDDRVIRPDMKVMLAEGKFVYVDAKVPLSAFLDAQEASEASERERCLKVFAQNVRSHADALSAKQYWKADEATPEFVVLLMPSEALYAEALQQMPSLTEYAAGKNIIIATPSTLIAMLRSVAYGWRHAALATSAKEITTLGQELYGRLSTMGHHFDRVGRGLASSVKAYNEAVGSMETRVMASARKFRDLKVTNEVLDEVKAVEELSLIHI